MNRKPRKKHVRRRKSSKKKKLPGAFIVAGLLLALSLAGAYYYFFIYREEVFLRERSDFLREIPAGYQSVGIDISHHQGKVNFDRLFVKERYDTLISWVYLKATEGDEHLDREYTRNREKLNELGIPNGAYHFFRTKEYPRPQVEHFLETWKVRDVDLPPVLDVETEGFSDSDLCAKMHIWLTEVEKRTGFRPVIYTSLHFYETKFKGQFPSHQFWIAAYTRQPPKNDPQIIHWQYSEDGELPGIGEKVDLNVSKVRY